MKLPNAEKLIVDWQKIVEYMLDVTHPRGATKARFFQEFGFHVDRGTDLAEALRAHGRENHIT